MASYSNRCEVDVGVRPELDDHRGHFLFEADSDERPLHPLGNADVRVIPLAIANNKYANVIAFRILLQHNICRTLQNSAYYAESCMGNR